MLRTVEKSDKGFRRRCLKMDKIFLVKIDSFWNILNLEEGDQAWFLEEVRKWDG